MPEKYKEKFKIGNCYLISDFPKNEEVRAKVIENIKDEFIVFRNLEDDSEFIFSSYNSSLSANDDIKYVCSKLDCILNLKREEFWNNKFKEEEFQKLDTIISRLNATNKTRNFLDISNHNFSYKFLDSN